MRDEGSSRRTVLRAGVISAAAALTGGLAAGLAPAASADTVPMPSALSTRRVRTAMSIAMAPARPYRNARLTATGAVTQLTRRGWVRLPGARVVLAFRPQGDRQWYWVVKGRADTAGHYRLVTEAYGPGTWATYLEPDTAHRYSESRQVFVPVR